MSFDNRLNYFENPNIITSNFDGFVKYAETHWKIQSGHWAIEEKQVLLYFMVYCYT